jgi:hypothetical protein
MWGEALPVRDAFRKTEPWEPGAIKWRASAVGGEVVTVSVSNFEAVAPKPGPRGAYTKRAAEFQTETLPETMLHGI